MRYKLIKFKQIYREKIVITLFCSALIVMLPCNMFAYAFPSDSLLIIIEQRIQKLEEKMERVDSMLSVLTTKLKSQDVLFDSTQVKSPPAKKEQVQCKAITKAGTRCTRKAKEGSSYCAQHEFLRKAK